MQRNHPKSALTITAVCHDAGGAEIISALIKKYAGFGWKVLAGGPAREIFRRCAIKTSSFKPAAIRMSDLLVTGTSLVPGIELHAIETALEAGIPSLTILDDWVNYKERFQINGRAVYPDYIAATDSEAYRLARRCRLQAKLVPLENPYWNSFLSVKPKRPKSYKQILLIGKRDESTEKAMLEKLSAVLKFPGLNIRYRRHPHARRSRLKTVTRLLNGLDVDSTETSLLEDLSWCDAVVGSGNKPLLSAIFAGRAAFQTHPDPRLSHIASIRPVSELPKGPFASVQDRFVAKQKLFNKNYPFDKAIRILKGSHAK